jgi:hypothetical protein
VNIIGLLNLETELAHQLLNGRQSVIQRRLKEFKMKISTLSLGVCCAVTLAFTAGCGIKKPLGEASLMSTDERPDISEDRTSVNITAGTKDHLVIRASELKALVSGVPDINTGEPKNMTLTGQFIFKVAQNPRTNMVAIAVRGMIYAETDYTMLFVVNPAVPNKPQLVKFVMPGKKVALDGSTPAFRAVRALSYDDSGLLTLKHSDASGSEAEVKINPDLTIRSCTYLRKDEGALCGENH